MLHQLGVPSKMSTSLSISLEAPEVRYPIELALRPGDEAGTPSARLLTGASKALLTFVESQPASLTASYRLELNPVAHAPGRWCMRIKLEAVAWYDHVVDTVGRNGAVHAARNYLTTIRRHKRQAMRESVPQAPAGEAAIARDPVQLLPYCTSPHCKVIRDAICRNGKHPAIPRCKYVTTRADGLQRECGYFCMDELRLDLQVGSEFKTMGLTCRREPTRDILLVPVNHRINKYLLQDPKTWEAIAAFQTKYGHGCFEGIAANFGKWESRNATDSSEHAVDCHGHIHLLVSPSCMDAIANETGGSAARGRTQHPPSHAELDARDLEICRLISHEHEMLREENKMLRERNDQLQAEVCGVKA
eukprot:Opistho-2@29774